MVSAKQARQNVECYKASQSAEKLLRVNTFIDEVVEPAIYAASTQGKNEIFLNFNDYLNVSSEVINRLHEAGFQTGRGRNDATIRVSWYSNGTPIHRNAGAIVVIHE